jgi:Ni/Fe-hydrogenase subunit HybB-like protein
MHNNTDAQFTFGNGLFRINFDKWSVRIAFDQWSFRITPVRVLLLLLAAAAGAIILLRLILGLQAVSNLNDTWPWGLWIGFDVMAGVALAGGGYGTALLIHVLHIERLKPIARATMLTSLIGYILVVTGLFIEIGRWWNFWRPFVSWGHESVLFEVFLCISAYTVIQVLELCEVITEKVFRNFHWIFVRIFPFLVIIGVILPTLHQSSLGALYLMADGKLHPLWWSPIIFAYFFLSSFFVGPAMVAVESMLADKSFGHKTPIHVLKSLARIGGAVMLLYLILKIGDLVIHNKIGLLFDGSFESIAFIAELGIGVVIPILIVFSPLSNIRGWIVTYGLLASFGVFFNRINVVVTGMIRDAGSIYYPALTEIAVSVGLVSAGILAYMFLCENFNILEESHEH